MTLIIRKRKIEHIPILEIVPKESANQSLPLVIYYHGWQTKKELALTAAKKIAAYNIRVVLPDAMYHGERKVTFPSLIPSFTFWSTIQYNISEFTLIKNFYVRRDLIKDNRLGVGGFSMGGMTTAALLTHFEEIKVAAILMGTTDFNNFISRTVNHLKIHTPETPFNIIDLLSWTKKYDLNRQPEKINQRPLYIWHGTNDEKLPYSTIHQFYLDNHKTTYGKNMLFETGNDEPHILTIDTMEKTGSFFDTYLNH